MQRKYLLNRTQIKPLWNSHNLGGAPIAKGGNWLAAAMARKVIGDKAYRVFKRVRDGKPKKGGTFLAGRLKRKRKRGKGGRYLPG